MCVALVEESGGVAEEGIETEEVLGGEGGREGGREDNLSRRGVGGREGGREGGDVP